jgi:hypothetical protein
MSDYDRSPDKIPVEAQAKDQKVIMFPVNGRQETVTVFEALSIINHISGCLMADSHGGGAKKFG